jgi:NADH-quinone oxidoreductase subunit G
VHSLLSGNLMDVCPVGAITTRDYRFKSRPWDNPDAVDTICTLCAKGCSTTAWIKAKPEWARASQLIRFTPRFNPEVNGYWMCDIGRFEYRWIESEDRLRRPLQRVDGVLQPTTWHDIMAKVPDRIAAAGKADPAGVQFLLSAHASHEELFLFRRLVQELIGDGAAAMTVSWRRMEKAQPPDTKFKVPAEDAPNVRGARLLGLVPGDADTAAVETARLRAAVQAGKVAALYVFDPGPDGSLGDTQWILDARQHGLLPLLIVQGVLLTSLARAADFVLPGASFVEKEASYTNEQGRLQGTARAMAPPGESMEDWQILVNLSAAFGVPFDYPSPAHVRAGIAAQFGAVAGLEGITTLAFARPVSASHWLQASNPSERWKWDFMFQDLPPVKGTVDVNSLPAPPGVIPLKEVK